MSDENKKPKVTSVSVSKAVTSDGKETQVAIHKISAYPIDASLIRADGAAPILCKIAKITEVGILVRLAGFVRVGDDFTIQFHLPVMRSQISEKVKTIKTHQSLDAYMGSGQKGIIAEFHFKTLSDHSRNAIKEFIAKIGQKK